MRSVPISHSITGPLARSIGPGFTGAERGKALTNAGGPSGPPFGVHYKLSFRPLVSPPGLLARRVRGFDFGSATTPLLCSPSAWSSTGSLATGSYSVGLIVVPGREAA